MVEKLTSEQYSDLIISNYKQIIFSYTENGKLWVKVGVKGWAKWEEELIQTLTKEEAIKYSMNDAGLLFLARVYKTTFEDLKAIQISQQEASSLKEAFSTADKTPYKRTKGP